MTTLAICIAIYVVIPVLGILLSGRKLAPLGWLVIIAIWPIAWLVLSPEELP